MRNREGGREGEQGHMRVCRRLEHVETSSPWQQSEGLEGSKGLAYRKSCCLSVRSDSVSYWSHC